MYAIVAQTKDLTLHAVGKDTRSVASAWDKLHLAKVNGPEGLILSPIHGQVTAVKILNVISGRILRSVQFEAPEIEVTEKTVAPSLKLSDTMRAALDSDDSGLTGLAGKANTLRALESRGLVKIQNDGVARLTDMGRQYRRV